MYKLLLKVRGRPDSPQLEVGLLILPLACDDVEHGSESPPVGLRDDEDGSGLGGGNKRGTNYRLL